MFGVPDGEAGVGGFESRCCLFFYNKFAKVGEAKKGLFGTVRFSKIF